MRTSAVVLALVTACYAPHPPSGVRCDEARPACPNGEACVAGVCGGTPEADSGVELDARPDGAVATQRFTIAPAIAVCMSAALADPSTCTTIHGQNTLFTTKADGFGVSWSSYLRFDIDAGVRAHTITAVALELTAIGTAQAASDDSGSVWQTQPFTQNSLTSTPPVKLGAAPLAASQGAVAKTATVHWTLPTTLDDALCLELDSGSLDPVLYWNATGTTPPRLVIDAE